MALVFPDGLVKKLEELEQNSNIYKGNVDDRYNLMSKFNIMNMVID